jgi:hypothetical protein
MHPMRLVATRDAGAGAGLASISGALPMMAEPETWPSWLIFCERVDVLHRWNEQEVLCVLYMKLPVVNIRIETMLYIRVYDLFEREGAVGATIAGGARIARMAEQLGISPPKPLDRGQATKANVDYCHVGIFPASGKQFDMRSLLSVEESCPMDWMVRYIWGTITGRLMGILSNQVEKRSAEKKSQNAEGFSKAAAEARLKFYQDMEQRIATPNAAAKRNMFQVRRCRSPSDASTSASDS